MIQTNRKGINYAENLLDSYLTFETTQTWTVSSGTGSGANSNDVSFYGTKSLKIQNTAPTTDITVTNSTQNTVIVNKTAEALLSFYLYKSSASDEFTGNVKIFKNAVLLDTQTWTLEASQDAEWYRFVSDQTYSLVTDDVITFTFTFDGDAGFVGAKNLYIDGLMLNPTERGDFAPPIYTPPNVMASIPSLPTSDGNYVLTYSNSIYSWVDERDYTGYASYVDDAYDSGSPFAVTASTDTIIPNNATTIVGGQKPTDIDEFYFSGGLVLTGVTGTFELNETLTGGTSGATSTLRRIDSGDYWFVNNSITPFQVSETVTGGTSGATATVAALLDPIITGRDGDGLALMLYFQCEPSAINAEIDIWVDIGGAVGELYRKTVFFRTTSAKSVLYTLPAAYTLTTFETNGGKIYINSSVNCDIYGFNFNFVRTHRAR